MTAYFAIALVAIFIATLSQAFRFTHLRSRKKTPYRFIPTLNPLDWLLIVVLVVFAGFRNEVGTDYQAYVNLFENRIIPDSLSDTLENSRSEIGFIGLLYILKQVFSDATIMFLTASTLTVGAVYFVIRRERVHLPTALLVYLSLGAYLTAFNGVRQGLAVGLAFLAYHFLARRRPSIFLVWSLVAVSMHYTAGIAVLVYWIVHRLRPKPSLTLMVTIITLGLIGRLMLGIFGDWLRTAGGFFARYGQFLELDPVGVGTYLILAFWVCSALYFLILCRRDPSTHSHQVLFMVGLAVLIVGLDYKVIARLADYFTIFAVLLFPRALLNTRHRIIHLSVLMPTWLIFMAMHLLHYGHMVPYHFSLP